jgi:hypothetical protein
MFVVYGGHRSHADLVDACFPISFFVVVNIEHTEIIQLHITAFPNQIVFRESWSNIGSVALFEHVYPWHHQARITR